MSKITIGWLYIGDLFKFENRVYRVGNLIKGTNGYVACVDIHTHKVTRFSSELEVEKLRKDGGVEYPFYQEAYQTGYEEGYAQGYVDGSTGADWRGDKE